LRIAGTYSLRNYEKDDDKYGDDIYKIKRRDHEHISQPALDDCGVLPGFYSVEVQVEFKVFIRLELYEPRHTHTDTLVFGFKPSPSHETKVFRQLELVYLFTATIFNLVA
jgi:hypothetical protein